MAQAKLKRQKLVRDRIPEIIHADTGVSLLTSTTTSYFDRIHWLGHKLVEEAQEVWHADEDDCLEELADVREVYLKLLDMRGLTEKQVEDVRLQKRMLKGGFDDFVLMEID